MSLGVDLEGSLINASGTTLVQGEIVRVSGTDRATKAQANTTAGVYGLYGAVVSGSAANGTSFLAAAASANGPVYCESGLTLTAGDRLYVSATVAGRATNVAPANAFVIGVVVDPSQYSRTGRVLAMYSASGGFGSSGGGSSAFTAITKDLTGTPPTGAIPLSGLGGPGILYFQADGTPSKANPYVNYLPGGDWFATEAKAHAALGLGFTASVGFVPGISATGNGLVATLGDAGKEGGAVRGLGGSVWNPLVPGTPYQNLKTSRLAISFQAAFAAIAGSQYTLLGVGTSAGHVIGFGTNQAADTSHFYLTATDGIGTAFTTPTTALADTNPHTWRLISDATTVQLLMDAVLQASGATSALHFPTDAGGPAIIGTTASSGQALYRILYSYVGN